MAWAIEYHELAKEDLLKLDKTHRMVLKAIEKVSQNSLPNYEGGYGKPIPEKVFSKGGKIPLLF